MPWELITNVILITSFLVLAVFAGLGLYQLAARKSLKNVDQELTAFIPTLAIMAVIYFIFDKIWIVSTRPDGSGEPSFPSTHTMVVATIFLCTSLALPKYIKNRKIRFILDLVMLILTILTAVGRVVSGKHWLTDVICGLVFAAVLTGIYFLILKAPKKNKLKERNHHG